MRNASESGMVFVRDGISQDVDLSKFMYKVRSMPFEEWEMIDRSVEGR